MKPLYIFLLILISCSAGNKFKPGDQVITKDRCMATTTEEAYKDMDYASKNKHENTLEKMLGEGKLLILNKGQKGSVVEPGPDHSKIKIIGGSEWWVANQFIKEGE